MVAADLRGYGDSGKRTGTQSTSRMQTGYGARPGRSHATIGFETFNVVGHDRGARVSSPDPGPPAARAELALLDIIPTHKMFRIVNKEMATSTYHWFFLIQPYDLPERLIGAVPERFLQNSFGRTPEAHAPEALAEYIRCFDAATIHATCEDYRAGASIDLVYDEADLNAGKKVMSSSLSYGVPKAMWAARRTSCKSGATMPPMCAASRCRVGIFWLRRCRTRRILSCARSCWGRSRALRRCERPGWAVCFRPR